MIFCNKDFPSLRAKKILLLKVQFNETKRNPDNTTKAVTIRKQLAKLEKKVTTAYNLQCTASYPDEQRKPRKFPFKLDP